MNSKVVMILLLVSCMNFADDRIVNMAENNNDRISFIERYTNCEYILPSSFDKGPLHTLQQILAGKVGGCQYVVDSGAGNVSTIFGYVDSEFSSVPVLFHFNKKTYSGGGEVIYIGGGPRNISAFPSPLLISLTEKGYAIIQPLYHGKVRSNQPDEDYTTAVSDISTIIDTVGHNLTGVIASSAGAYLYVSSCAKFEGTSILLAPLLSKPSSVFVVESTQPVGFSEPNACIMDEKDKIVCIESYRSIIHFWGKRWDREAVEVPCQRNIVSYSTTIASADDKIVPYDDNERIVRDSSGIIITVYGIGHNKMESDLDVISSIVNIISE